MRSFLIYSALIALATCAVYWPVGGHDFVNYDDTLYVTRNAEVQAGLTWEGLRWAFSSATTGNWHPLTWLSHMLDVELFGMRPSAHHWMNVAMHALACVLLLAFLGYSTRLWHRSAAVAALFALHPLHVESVAWVAERKDVLCAVFFFLTLLAYARFVRCRSWYAYATALLAFALALMAKPMAVTLPFVLLLIDVWPLKRVSLPGLCRKTAFTLLVEKTPFIVLSGAVSAATFLLQHQVEGVRSLGDTGLGLRTANALVSYASYLGKTFVPVQLAAYYPYPVDGIVTWKVVSSAALLAALSIAAVLFIRRRPWFAVGWFWFLGMLVPVIGLVQVGSQAMADRYMYLPMAGLLFAVAWTVPSLLPSTQKVRLTLVLASLVICAVLGALTLRQVGYWKDSIALFEHTLAVAGDSATTHTNLGGAYLERGELEKALHHSQRAVEIKPNDVNARNNIGIVLLSVGKPEDAAKSFAAAAQLQPDNPEIHFNLGLAYKAAGRSNEARVAFTTAIALNPAHVKARMEIGDMLLNEGRGEEAAEQYRAVLAREPHRAEAWLNLGIGLASAGWYKDAVPCFERGLALEPDHAEGHYYLAKTYAALGRSDDAADELRRAVTLRPGFSAAEDLLLHLNQAPADSP
ncbi:MAG: hypothetical protein AMXMBFR82_14180 [Candidatus Hydrogenedentota bacterium]